MAAQTKKTARKSTGSITSVPVAAAPAVTAAHEDGADARASRPDPKGKLGALVTLLRRPGGAQLAELMAATGWQAHSVRGAIAGALKKKLGLTIISAKTETGRIYRIVEAGA
ncbi:MAG TPA: DUF3489 domain-containing protein [Caulobacteraceae bacterium]|nr:DUF3489 domain-containing protein [Caulobacteraceae bacterium]